MKRNVLWFGAMLWLIALALTGCNSKNVRDVEYDLSTEMGREMHCYAQFQKNVKADSYWAEWVNEVNNGFGAMVEWKVKADDEEYNLVCNFSDDLGEFSINYTPLDAPEIWNPASEYCLEKWWSYAIVSDEMNIYGECTLPDGTKCEQWALFYWGCQQDDSDELNFDLETVEGRKAACEERAGFYLNFNEWTFTWEDESEGWASFIRNGHVDYLKRWENAEDDVECVVDMVDKSVNVEFSNHIYNGELQEDIEVPEQPVAKMRVLEWESEEEMQQGIIEICSNVWGEWIDWLCHLEDGSTIAF